MSQAPPPACRLRSDAAQGAAHAPLSPLAAALVSCAPLRGKPSCQRASPFFHLFLVLFAARQVVEETHAFYNKLRSGARANTEELSLV